MQSSSGGLLKMISAGAIALLALGRAVGTNSHAKKDVIPTCKHSLADLQLEYLDLYLSTGRFRTIIPRIAIWIRVRLTQSPTFMRTT